jgi:hypothetical protein
MTAFSFTGVLLPDGVSGEVVVGEGDVSALPGAFAVRGLVDGHCHVTVDEDDDEDLFLSDRAFADGRLAQLAREGVTVLRDVGGRSEITLDYARGPQPGLTRWPTPRSRSTTSRWTGTTRRTSRPRSTCRTSTSRARG